jgi:hypothetical protein
MGMNGNLFHGSKSVRITELTHGRPTPTYGGGRVCAAAGCGTHLSLYNPQVWCSIHDHAL